MSALVALLQEGRARELGQAAFYRRLAAAAEGEGDDGLADRFNGLLADEQHHVSRLTARLLELGERPAAAGARPTQAEPVGDVGQWLTRAEEMEALEVRWYEQAVLQVEDAQTTSVLREILESERNHVKELGGKWMSAGARTTEHEST